MIPRLKAGIFVRALIRRAEVAGAAAFVVRKGVPALSFAVHNEGTLKRVLVSTPDAEELVRQLKDA